MGTLDTSTSYKQADGISLSRAAQLAAELHRDLVPKFPDARIYGVGSAARDFAAGNQFSAAHDLDFEIFGVPKIDLQSNLETTSSARFAKVVLGGNAYVAAFAEAHDGIPVSISTPLRLSENPQRYNPDSVIPDHNLSFADAAKRRDLTINAVGYDYAGRTKIDPHGGLEHLAQRKLVMLNPVFGSDPIEIIRTIKIAVEQQFALDEALQERLYQSSISPRDLSRENFEMNRFARECGTLLLSTSAPPSKFLALMEQLGIGTVHFPAIRQVFSELRASDDSLSKKLDSAWRSKLLESDGERRMAAVLSVFVEKNLDDAARVTRAHIEREAAIVAREFCAATSELNAGCRLSKVTEYILEEFEK